MGKRLTCPRCQAVNEYDVPPIEATVPLREVRCRPCGHRFNYGFAPEYVTAPDPELTELGAAQPANDLDIGAEVSFSRDRLARHVARHAEYHDRDRDILLLHLVDMADHLDHELSSIKRAIDVISKRGSSR